MTTTISRDARIIDIIASRQPMVERIKQVQQNLGRRAEKLLEVEAFQKAILANTEPEVAQLVEPFRQLDLHGFQKRIEDAQKELALLLRRFSRPTLNIGVIGRARQGKSRLLQSLSSLGTNEIPDGDADHCTGVRSTIYNNTTSDDDTYALVYFYTEHELLNEVIAPYYAPDKLNLGPVPRTLDEFSSTPLYPTESKLARQKAMYDHLSRYKQKISQYRDLLAKVPDQDPLRIPKELIRQYVAQDDEQGNRVYFNYLAVREVRIYCHFPQEDVGKIAMIDMPGLGDTGVGDEERLIKALSEEIDIALLVRKPAGLGDFWGDVDLDLYDLPQKSKIDLPMSKWSFLVLNQTDSTSKNGDNMENCKRLLSALLPGTASSTSSGQHIEVVQAMIANCSRPLEVADEVLEPVLKYLVEHMADLDIEYSTKCEQRLEQLQQDIREELHKAQQLLGDTSALVNAETLFNERFEELWDALVIGLEEATEDLGQKRDVEDPAFRAYFDTIFDQCLDDAVLPTLKEVDQLTKVKGSARIAHDEYLHWIRTDLTHRFFQLDHELKTTVMEDVKKRVALTFAEVGGLNKITRAEGSTFFEVIVEKIPNDKDIDKLRHMFHMFTHYELSYRGFFQSRIRKNLEQIVPYRTGIPDKANPTKVVDSLNDFYNNTVTLLRDELYECLREPSQGAFAIAEEFIDQIIRARNAKAQMKTFYLTIRDEVWPEHFKKIRYWGDMKQRWDILIREAIHINETQRLQFRDSVFGSHY